MMNLQGYEKDGKYAPLIQTACSLLRHRGKEHTLSLLSNSKIDVVNTEYDNWNGGIHGYTLYLSVSSSVYASFSPEEITSYEKEIEDVMNEVIKSDEQSYFKVCISPVFMPSDTDWNCIGGEDSRRQLKSSIEEIQNIMVSVATGGPRIETKEMRYKELDGLIRNSLGLLKIQYLNPHLSLWDWYGEWRRNLPTYQERREYIHTLFSNLSEYFTEDVGGREAITPLVDLTDWHRIQRTVVKIKRGSAVANTEEDFQSIGLLCRECIITIAQSVYSADEHGEYDAQGTRIGNTDAQRMLGNYFQVKFPGSSNEEYRAYAKATNKLANVLTHRRTARKKDMLLAVSATIGLINLIGIIEGKQ